MPTRDVYASVRGQRQNVCLYRVHALNYLPPFDDSCNHTRVENLIFIGQRFFSVHPSNITLLTPSPRPLLSYLPAAAAFWTSHFCLPLPSAPFHPWSSPSTYLLPVAGSSLSPTPLSLAPRIYFPPTRPRLIPLSLSIYLYQWAKVTLSSSSRWTDSTRRGRQEERGAEYRGTPRLSLYKFDCIKLWEYYINSPLQEAIIQNVLAAW